MPAGNAEIVKEIIELMNRAEPGKPPPGLLDRFAPDVRVDMSRRVFNPDVYEGHDGLRRLADDVREVWREFRLEPERFIEVDDRVIVIETRRGRGWESGMEVEQRSASVWTLRDGLVVRMETDLDPDEVL